MTNALENDEDLIRDNNLNGISPLTNPFVSMNLLQVKTIFEFNSLMREDNLAPGNRNVLQNSLIKPTNNL